MRSCVAKLVSKSNKGPPTTSRWGSRDPVEKFDRDRDLSHRFSLRLLPHQTCCRTRTPMLRPEAGWCSRRDRCCRRRRRQTTATGLNRRHRGWPSSHSRLLRSGPEKATGLAEMVPTNFSIFSHLRGFSNSAELLISQSNINYKVIQLYLQLCYHN